VLPAVAAGVLLAVVQVGRPDALWTTGYGRVLLAKLALLAGLFSLAGINRRYLTRPALAGDGPVTRRLIQSIGIEIILVLAILAVVAVWRFTPPPRSLDAATNVPALTHIHTDKAMVDLSITPGRTGPVSASMLVRSGDFGALEAKEVILSISKPDAGIEPIRRAAVFGNGRWTVDGLLLPVAGEWTVRVGVLITDFDIVNLDGKIGIRP
jgi:copper transport protein